MKEITKNIATNIIGLILLGFNIYEYYVDDFTLTEFIIGLCLSLGLFLFKATETKDWIRKALEKLTNKNK